VKIPEKIDWSSVKIIYSKQKEDAEEEKQR
jgi:hypothetical protein